MAVKSLETLELGLPLAGNEGLDPNYVSRIRIQFLLTQHQSIIAQMQFADAKAAALITLVGIATLRSPLINNITKLNDFAWLNASLITIVAISIFFTLLSVFPRYPSKRIRQDMWKNDRWSWPALATHDLTPDDYADFMRSSEVSQLIQSIALSNTQISSVLLMKYRMLRIGFIFGTLAFFLAIAALLGII